MTATADDGWDITIGDPVRVVKADNQHLQDSCAQPGVCGTDTLFEVTFLGPARSYELGSTRFEQGKVRLVSDETVAKRCMSTPGFQVRLTSRGVIQMGRVLTIYLKQSQSVEFFDDKNHDTHTDYDFVVVAPNGAICAADEITRLDDADKARLLKEEMEELINGEQPYRHKLRMVGKGKWGAL